MALRSRADDKSRIPPPRTAGMRGGEQSNDGIRSVAYQLYEKRGRQPGRELEDWLEAERIIGRKTGSNRG